jgi:hypothetical protein
MAAYRPCRRGAGDLVSSYFPHPSATPHAKAPSKSAPSTPLIDRKIRDADILSLDKPDEIG